MLLSELRLYAFKALLPIFLSELVYRWALPLSTPWKTSYYRSHSWSTSS